MDSYMSTRVNYLLGLAAASLIILTSVYLQLYEGFVPCPLCTLQRLTFGLLASFFIVGIILASYRMGRLLTNLLLLLTSFLGLFLSGRQIWLQHFPPTDATECGVSLQYMMQALPINEVAGKILQGSAECTQRGTEFFVFNVAEWSFIAFTGFAVWSIYLLARHLKR